MIIRLLEEEYPEAKISLDFTNVYELLVGTMLSAQTTDNAVNKVTKVLFNKYPNINSLAEADLGQLKKVIKSIGLYNTKATNLKNMANIVVREFNGKIPNSMSELIQLPGVGRKTANVVLGNGFGIKDSGITVDTHMIRVFNRLGMVTGKNALKIEEQLLKIVPKDHWVEITHLIISHGRAICQARNPDCQNCVLTNFCPKIGVSEKKLSS